MKNTRANIKSSYTGGRFILIVLTAVSGNAVMCIIIFIREDLSFAQRIGHDIRVIYDKTKNVTENSGTGKVFTDLLTCYFRGEKIPALVACSKK